MCWFDVYAFPWLEKEDLTHSWLSLTQYSLILTATHPNTLQIRNSPHAFQAFEGSPGLVRGYTRSGMCFYVIPTHTHQPLATVREFWREESPEIVHSECPKHTVVILAGLTISLHLTGPVPGSFRVPFVPFVLLRLKGNQLMMMMIRESDVSSARSRAGLCFFFVLGRACVPA